MQKRKGPGRPPTMHLAGDGGLTKCGKSVERGRITKSGGGLNCKECLKSLRSAAPRVASAHPHVMAAVRKTRRPKHTRWMMAEAVDVPPVQLGGPLPNEWPLPISQPFESVEKSIAIGAENAHRALVRLSEKDALTAEDVKTNAEACTTLGALAYWLRRLGPRGEVIGGAKTPEARAADAPREGNSAEEQPAST